MVFEEIKLTWGGESFTCPPDRVWKMIAHLESNGVDIMGISQQGGIVNKCSALSESLRFLGMSNYPSAEEVYESLFLGESNNIQNVMFALQMMVVPPNIRKQALSMSPEEAEKKAEEAKKKPAKRRKREKAS